jgi:sigma-B regulation protein RsbU (phosphoserine phosphatase)
MSSMFVTVFYGILNLKTGELQYSNAGHNPPYILQKDGNVKTVEGTGDIVLGVMDNMDYHSKSIKLNPFRIIFAKVASTMITILFSQIKLEHI